MVGTTVILLSRFIEIRLIIISYFKLVNAPLKHISNMNQAIYFLIKKVSRWHKKESIPGAVFLFCLSDSRNQKQTKRFESDLFNFRHYVSCCLHVFFRTVVLILQTLQGNIQGGVRF